MYMHLSRPRTVYPGPRRIAGAFDFLFFSSLLSCFGQAQKIRRLDRAQMLGNTAMQMSTATGSIKIRPIRFGFAVDPEDRAALQDVFRLNTVLWGGLYNFIIPIFKKTPKRYREPFLKTPSANALVNGLVDAFQPDFLVETKPGLATDINFPRTRVISTEQLAARDEQDRCTYGIDVRSLYAALYDETFRFVQRHPPKVVVPHCPDQRFELLFAAMFGEFPASGILSDCIEHYKGALNAKDETIAPIDFPRLFQQEYLFPLRVGAHELTTDRQGWSPDPMLFYMDERATYDLIEFWNLRAIGWRISPLPHSLAEALKDYCEKFITDSHRPFPPPSNAFQHASFLCSRSCKMDQLQSFLANLKRPVNDAITLDTRFPRLWEEWGRSADHAEPQNVTHATKSIDVHMSTSALNLRTVLPDFIELAPFAAKEHACANVLESVPGGALVIPWRKVKLEALTWRFGDKRIWVGREGIVTTAAEYSLFRFLRAPSPINVFSAFAESDNFKLSLSPAGQTCEQIIAALGGLEHVRLIANEDILKMLDKLAHGDLEIEVDEDEPGRKRRVRTASAPYSHVQETLMRANGGNADVVANHLSALVRQGVLKLGMRLKCTECMNRSWYSLEDLSSILKCPRCMRQFSLSADSPPRDDWAYRVLGPFAVENFAHGSYCVAATLRFLAEEVAQACTWIPSFEMSRPDMQCEADFGMFLRQTHFSHVRGPLLILGECKTFGTFEDRDFRRARTLRKLFPGVILCFATLREALTTAEKREISRIAQSGRARLKTGQQKGPVLVLTRIELFGQFKIARFTDDYGARSKYAEMAFMRRDLQELCDFTQQVHLGMEPYHDWLDKKRQKRALKLSNQAPA
jgi:hypothetical protein